MADINPQNDVQSALLAGLSMAEPTDVDGTPVLVVPPGSRVEDLEKLLNTPTRRRGTIKLRDTDSFIRFVNEEKSRTTRIYYTQDNPSFVAVFNDDGDSPGWKDHRAVFSCPLSAEWETWKERDGRSMSQIDFARFIEDNLPDIANPPAADMLEISRSLEAKKKVNFASGIRLSNGQNELTYEEEISGTAAKGKLQVPEQFTIGIPVFENGARYAVDVRLRYRIGDGGQLAMWYELIRPHKIMEDAVDNVRVQILDKTEVMMFNGTV